MIVGIRREDKNRWERRAPLTPDDVAGLIASTGLRFHVQPSPLRIFADAEYARAGAEVREDLSGCDLILAVKEIPLPLLLPGKSYLYFAHVVKGQAYNMPMLRRLLDLGCTLFDYELIADERNRRLVFFGRYAGLAGMIDTLHALGRRLEIEGIASPFAEIRAAHEYADLEDAKGAIGRVGATVAQGGLDERLVPLVVGVTGYGHVSQGVQEILALLPLKTIEPGQLGRLGSGRDVSRHHLYKVVFEEEHMVAPRDGQARFELQDYYDHPEKYVSQFEGYLPHLSVLVNCIYWTERYPRLVTKDAVAALFAPGARPRLRVIGDISCDIDGSVEVTGKATDPDRPCFVYEAATGRLLDGYEGHGPVVMAVDNLPCEIARESSGHFSRSLRDLIAASAGADLEGSFENLRMPEPLKRAAIAWQGRLLPRFAQLEECLAKKEPDGKA